MIAALQVIAIIALFLCWAVIGTALLMAWIVAPLDAADFDAEDC